MRKIKTLAISLCFIFSCSKQNVEFKDLISDIQFIPEKQLIANGQDAVLVRVFFNKESVIENINGTVTVSNAIIQESGSNELKLSPTRDLADPALKDEVIVEFFVKSTTLHADHRLNFNVNMFENNSTVIPSIRSVPSSVSLSINSFSIEQNYGSEVTLSATVLNSEGKKVSNGAKARFRDVFEDGTPVNGRFREERLSSNNESVVSAIYSLGLVEINQEITIIVELLDDEENLLGISDSKRIIVTTND